jgi:hypothetical protein
MNQSNQIFTASEGKNSAEKDVDPESFSLPRDLASNDPREIYKRGAKDAAKKLQDSEVKDIRMEAVREGVKEHIKEKVIDNEKVKDKLKTLVEHEDVVLLKAKTFFPFDLFPDTLTIDTTKVSITKKLFFATENLTIINYKDIADVELETSLFLANLKITYLPKIEGFMPPEPQKIKIRLLHRSDAVKAQHTIKGLLIARREGIDIARLKPEELTTVITQLGESNVEI